MDNMRNDNENSEVFLEGIFVAVSILAAFIVVPLLIHCYIKGWFFGFAGLFLIAGLFVSGLLINKYFPRINMPARISRKTAMVLTFLPSILFLLIWLIVAMIQIPA